MAQMVRVKLASSMGDRAALHEQHPDHPGGQVAVDTQSVIYTVALTPAVSDRIGRKMLVLVETIAAEPGDAPAEPEPAPKPAPTRRRGRARLTCTLTSL